MGVPPVRQAPPGLGSSGPVTGCLHGASQLRSGPGDCGGTRNPGKATLILVLEAHATAHSTAPDARLQDGLQ
jgi:hypothetical protein